MSAERPPLIEGSKVGISIVVMVAALKGLVLKTLREHAPHG